MIGPAAISSTMIRVGSTMMYPVRLSESPNSPLMDRQGVAIPRDGALSLATLIVLSPLSASLAAEIENLFGDVGDALQLVIQGADGLLRLNVSLKSPGESLSHVQGHVRVERVGAGARLRGLKRRSSKLHDRLPVSYTHLRAHETDSYLVCRL